jgi:VanZ family protein
MLGRLIQGAILWLPVAAWAGLIFAFSAQPDLRFLPDQGLDFLLRKAGHMSVFGVLAVLLWRALASSTVRRPIAWSLILTALYAASDELHQSFTSGRHPSPLDVGIDLAGALLALAALSVRLRLRAEPR